MIINSIRRYFRASSNAGKREKSVYSKKPEEKKPSQIDKDKVVDADYEDL